MLEFVTEAPSIKRELTKNVLVLGVRVIPLASVEELIVLLQLPRSSVKSKK